MPPSQDLTARIRALYEETSVPVREIAQIAGVSERTLYKYVAKRGWKKRYAANPRGLAAAAANRGRRWQYAQGFAPAQGAGGRFIRREDIGAPFASGLKALDADGRARAHAACDAAEPAAREAQREAERGYRDERRLRALAAVDRATAALETYTTQRRERETALRAAQAWHGDPARRPKVPPAPGNDDTERGLTLALSAALDWLEAEQRARAAAEQDAPAP